MKNLFHFKTQISELRSLALWRCFFFLLLLCSSFAFDEGGFRRSCHSGGGIRQKDFDKIEKKGKKFIFPLHNVTTDPFNSFVDRLKQLSVTRNCFCRNFHARFTIATFYLESWINYFLFLTQRKYLAKQTQ